ncbi:MAG: DUF397 domain-containing protein [Mycobacterium sp.]
MATANVGEPRWRKSSYSGNNGQCVELAILSDGMTAIRDSKNPNGGIVLLTGAEWTAFRDTLTD